MEELSVCIILREMKREEKEKDTTIMEEVLVVIVGAGPSGLATSACLTRLNIANLVLEKEDCSGSLWKQRTYDRLNLHLAKGYCSLPHMPHPSTTPTYIPKADFVEYLDTYVKHFNIKPHYCRVVVSASFNEVERKWRVEAQNTVSGDVEVYKAKFLVVATGENGEGFIPKIDGLDSFKGEILHSSQYQSGLRYKDRKVLVVGCGNSGMEIAYDLSNFGAHPSIVIRNPFHILTREMVRLGMMLLRYFPVTFVDAIVNFLSTLKYGDLSDYGIHRPLKGPFLLKATSGRSPVIEVGTMIKKIKAGEIEVLPTVSNIEDTKVVFENKLVKDFDVIVFATGYRSLALKWLKDYEYVLNDDGMPKEKYPSHWKGKNGIYCAGLSQRGLDGISMDAKSIANDIKRLLMDIREKIE